MSKKLNSLGQFLLEGLQLPLAIIQKPEIEPDQDFTISHAGEPDSEEIKHLVTEFYRGQGFEVKLVIHMDQCLTGSLIKGDEIFSVCITNAVNFRMLMVSITKL